MSERRKGRINVTGWIKAITVWLSAFLNATDILKSVVRAIASDRLAYYVF
ncbi:MAG: hypothetical protein V2J25_08135 [Desulfatiglans sp.]|jgi:hypothetical protein|nr:hypothetical protein [Desulfatiglans sp.]